MTAVDTELDIVTLVGEMPALGCEHEGHGNEPHAHADGNEQYVRISLPCGCANLTEIYCGKYVTALAALGDTRMHCKICPAEFLLKECVFPLGPVRRFVP